jgi:hypothetical protein
MSSMKVGANVNSTARYSIWILRVPAGAANMTNTRKVNDSSSVCSDRTARATQQASPVVTGTCTHA